MKYVSLEEVLAVHKMVIDVGGGSIEVRDWGLLLSAIEQPKQQAFGQDLYPDIISKAAVLFYSLSQNHPFVDGNKRASYFSTLRFLEMNGFEIVSNDKEVFYVIIILSSGELDKKSLETWLKEKVRKK